MDYCVSASLFLFGVFEAIKGNTIINDRAILFLTNGSSLYFDELWANDSYNDPYNNKSVENNFSTLFSGGDFKATIDPAWGEPIEFRFVLINSVGGELSEFIFDVYGADPSNLSEWLTTGSYTDHWPYMNITTYPTIRNGNKELILQDSTGSAFFAIVHEPQWPTAFILATNTTGFFNTTDLENISQPSNEILMTYRHTDSTDIIELTPAEFQWADDFFYMSGIKVFVPDTLQQSVNYTVSYVNATNGAFEFLDDVPCDGFTYTFPTLYVEHLRVTFETPVNNITLTVFGPTDTSFVDAAALYVYGLFGVTSTTTSSTTSSSTSSSTSSTSSTTSSSTASSTSTTSSTTSSTSSSSTSSMTSTTTASHSNSSVLINGTWYCPCVQSSNISYTNQTLNEIVAEIVANLTVDKDKLSSNTRKYTSAEDDRPSAKTLGAAGVIVIAAVLSSIVYIDGATLIKELTKITKNYKRLKKRLSKRNLKIENTTPDADIDTQVQDVDLDATTEQVSVT